MNTARKTLAVLASWVAVLGCADDGESSINPDPCVPSLCDIRAAECQRDVALAVQCFRGGTAVMPEVEVIEPEALDAMWQDEEPTEEQRTQYGRLMRGLALFGLADADASIDDLRADVTAEIAAIYDPESGHILIVDRGSSMNDKASIATLAHEMVHAMQDAEHDLRALLESAHSTDELLAIKALVEGEATHYEVVTYAALEGAGPERIRWGSLYAQLQWDQVDAALEDASPIAMSAIRFPYAYGGSYVTNLILSEGQGAVTRRFDAPPKSTREVLLDSAATPSGLDSEGIPVIEGAELLDHDRLGAWLLYIARMSLDRTSSSPNPFDIARGAGEDVVSVFHIADGDRVVAAWRQRVTGAASGSAGENLTYWTDALRNSRNDRIGALAWLQKDDVFLLASDAELDPDLATNLVWTMVPENTTDRSMNAAGAFARVRRGCGHVTPLSVPLSDD